MAPGRMMRERMAVLFMVPDYLTQAGGQATLAENEGVPLTSPLSSSRVVSSED